jgi:hypothetical protein
VASTLLTTGKTSVQLATVLFSFLRCPWWKCPPFRLPQFRLFHGLVLLLIVSAIGFGAAFFRLQGRLASLQTQVGQLETEWTTISAYSQEAQSVQPQFDLVSKRPKVLAEEMAAKSWAPALRTIVASTGPEVELRDIRARMLSTDLKTCVLAVAGVSTGSAPRVSADHFRLALQRELERKFPGAVSTQFERLDDEPPSLAAPAEKQRATFEIAATIALKPKPLEGIK